MRKQWENWRKYRFHLLRERERKKHANCGNSGNDQKDGRGPCSNKIKWWPKVAQDLGIRISSTKDVIRTWEKITLKTATVMLKLSFSLAERANISWVYLPKEDPLDILQFLKFSFFRSLKTPNPWLSANITRVVSVLPSDCQNQVVLFTKNLYNIVRFTAIAWAVHSLLIRNGLNAAALVSWISTAWTQLH